MQRFTINGLAEKRVLNRNLVSGPNGYITRTRQSDFERSLEQRYTHGRSAESTEERSTRVQAAPHLHVIIHAVLFFFQFEREERQVHVHVGFGLDGPFASGVVIVVQVAVIGMRIKVLHVVRGYQSTAANCGVYETNAF